MHGDNIFQIINIISIWAGLTLIVLGITNMRDSAYTPPEAPIGWIMGILWIIIGGIIAHTWVMFTISKLVEQKCLNRKRWSMSKMLTSSLVLILAGGCAILGTWYTWKHTYRIGDCGCTVNEWGPQCKPCLCAQGVCHSGDYGTGVCSCDIGWAGTKCNRCDISHKPEPDLINPIVGGIGKCNICKTGFAGEKCDKCAVGYIGNDCDMCDTGWEPWQHTSGLFPNAIADDNRHICDECKPNHWGFYCLACPVGNDVPHKTLHRNYPLVISETRVMDINSESGILHAIETCSKDTTIEKCSTWTSQINYDPNNPFVLNHVRIQIKYDSANYISKWLLLKDIKGFQCNNRGTCLDDKRHQEANPDWNKNCTTSYVQECTVHSDCKTSENCKGTCQGIELPINAIWSRWNGDGIICADDSDCRGTPVGEDVEGNALYYTGGSCVSRFCCDESYHGTGTCDCDPQFFGPSAEDGFIPHNERSPSCDFCPGYDWLTEEPTTICSGGKGTCQPSYARALEANVQGEYLNMKCNCGEEVYIDPETGIVDPSVIITWSGELCECGDVDSNGVCDFCASGHWGKECKICPGGAGERACSGHGTCNSGIFGDGTCLCNIDRESSWMLADYIPRYSGDCEYCGNPDKDIRTCNECAPNFWGETCLRCDDMDDIKPSELDDIFQPITSFHFGMGQSSLLPHSVCHPQRPTSCSLACGGGGWCNWGRRGDGTCTCWSNIREEASTWNPLDNVCIGTTRFDPTSNDTFQGIKEQCPSYGYCENGGRSRKLCSALDTALNNCGHKFTKCGPEFFVGDVGKNGTIDNTGWSSWKDWADSEGSTPGLQNRECTPTDGTCFRFMTIDWRPSNSEITCDADYR